MRGGPRGGRSHGVRRRDRGGRPVRSLRLPRRADRAGWSAIHAGPLRTRHGAVRDPAGGRRARSSQADDREVSMSSQVTLPRLGQGMESGTIVRWLKAEGDQVEKGEPLYELDTEKVTQEVEAESSGTLLKILAGEGEEIEVGKPIAVIGEPGEDVPDAPSKPERKGAPEAAAEGPPAAEAQTTSQPAPATRAANGGRVKASALARRIARGR